MSGGSSTASQIGAARRAPGTHTASERQSGRRFRSPPLFAGCVEIRVEPCERAFSFAGSMDLTDLERMCKGDRGRMRQYVDLYLEEAPPLVARMVAALDVGDSAELAAGAHALRPVAHRMGAPELFAALTGLEQSARTVDAAACARALHEVRTWHHQLIDGLASWREREGLGT